MSEPLAMLARYGELHSALRRRADALGIPRKDIDIKAGLPDGYAAKLLGDPPIKRMSLDVAFAVAGSLGLAMALVEDAEAMNRIADLVGKRHEERVYAPRSAVDKKRQRRMLQKLGRIGFSKWMAQSTPEQRRVLAKKAARARWGRRRRWRGTRPKLTAGNTSPTVS